MGKSEEDIRGAIGMVYRITAEYLREKGLFEDVKAKASPSTREVLEKPPFPFAWRSQVMLEEIERILHAMPGGPQLCVGLGEAAAERLIHSVVEPVFRMAMTLFGATPESVFANLDRFYPMVVRGYTFRYESQDPRNGVVQAEIRGGGIHPSLFDQIRGNLTSVYSVLRTQGSVDEPAVLRHDDAGAVVRFGVRWA
jgi:hypothetical protein